ncbi:hypothetical protein [Shewanella sp. ALD9]|uniref:hypothetical protein n=1 Tax=Shewanella sp. ALD9 TaxID=2058330 RepID=UPI000C31C8D4|nr:hypothetical protein [Shewanella sp. ALD9]PKH29093.1 hypothetical protein CXF88_19410 [Shewanella sp. ALD9]
MDVETLWDGKKAYLPQKLSALYLKELTTIEMLDHAKNYMRQENEEGPVGGQGIKETHIHFAERFSNSCIRLQYVLIDPNEKFGNVPENFFSTFSTGKIALLDAPCGTGAGALSLLYTLKELRVHKKLPQLPLEIEILACDFSESARSMYSKLLDEAIPELATVDINVVYTIRAWDAFSMPSTTLLMRDFVKLDCEEFFVLVSAFSGIDKKNYQKLDNSLTHIQMSLSPEQYTVVHVEPSTRNARSLFSRLKNIFMLIFTSASSHEQYRCEERFLWLDPVNGRDAKSTVSVSINSRNKA